MPIKLTTDLIGLFQKKATLPQWMVCWKFLWEGGVKDPGLTKGIILKHPGNLDFFKNETLCACNLFGDFKINFCATQQAGLKLFV